MSAEPDIDDLARRLLRLEDESTIIRVLYKYAEAIDYGDEAGWADCFTDDAVWQTENLVNGVTRERIGRQDLLGFAAGHTRSPELYHKHMVVSPTVTVTGDSATSASYLQLLVGGPGGQPHVRLRGIAPDCPDKPRPPTFGLLTDRSCSVAGPAIEEASNATHYDHRPLSAGITVSDTGTPTRDLRTQWPGLVDALAEKLKAAGDNILAQDLDDIDRVEGIRVLLRDVRMSMERVVENFDRDFPFFSEIYGMTYHLIGDTPDYAMHAARLHSDKEYLITGNVGTSARFSFTSQGPAPDTPDGDVMGALVYTNARAVIAGTLDSEHMAIDPDGTFEIVVSPTRPDSGNWLPMGPQTNLILVRNEFHDRFKNHWRYMPTKLQIERIDGPSRPSPLLETDLVAALEKIAQEAGTITLGRPRFFENIRAQGDQDFSADQAKWAAAGANPRTTFHVAYWELPLDEALIIEVDSVPDSSFWILGLTNVWMETLDFRFYDVNLNKFTATYLPSGGLRIVVAERDPGVPNWLDPAGHRRGTLVWRWNYPQTAPEAPRMRRVPISEVRGLN